jgi:hypothetical protein
MSRALGSSVTGTPDTLVVDVRQDVDVFLARAEARNLAERSGFSGAELEEIARLATALATHVVQRKAVGAIHLRSVRDGRHGPGIIIMTVEWIEVHRSRRSTAPPRWKTVPTGDHSRALVV